MPVDNEPEDKKPKIWTVGTRSEWFMINGKRVPVYGIAPITPLIVYTDPYPEESE